MLVEYTIAHTMFHSKVHYVATCLSKYTSTHRQRRLSFVHNTQRQDEDTEGVYGEKWGKKYLGFGLGFRITPGLPRGNYPGLLLPQITFLELSDDKKLV